MQIIHGMLCVYITTTTITQPGEQTTLNAENMSDAGLSHVTSTSVKKPLVTCRMGLLIQGSFSNFDTHTHTHTHTHTPPPHTANWS